jgi:hypothetical protein
MEYSAMFFVIACADYLFSQKTPDQSIFCKGSSIPD